MERAAEDFWARKEKVGREETNSPLSKVYNGDGACPFLLW